MLNRQATNRDYSNAIDNKLKAYKVYGKTYGPCLSDKLLRPWYIATYLAKIVESIAFKRWIKATKLPSKVFLMIFSMSFFFPYIDYDKFPKE